MAWPVHAVPSWCCTRLVTLITVPTSLLCSATIFISTCPLCADRDGQKRGVTKGVKGNTFSPGCQRHCSVCSVLARYVAPPTAHAVENDLRTVPAAPYRQAPRDWPTFCSVLHTRGNPRIIGFIYMSCVSSLSGLFTV
jgi:hypothetical protein